MDANEESHLHPEQPTGPEPITVSLQKVLRKTCFLFWQHPLLLWSPLLIADIAKYWVGLVGTYLSRAVIHTLLPHSVLSGQPDSLTPGTHLAVIELTAGVVTWISYALSFFLYSLAFIFIANRVHKLTVQPDQNFRLHGSRIIAIALKLTFLLTCLSLAVALLSGWAYPMLPITLFQKKQTLPILLAVFTSATAIFAARPFLRAASLDSIKSRTFTSRVTILAWLLLISPLLVSFLLSLGLMHANIPFPTHPSVILIHLYGVLTSLIAAMPYIFMMIGITLLTEEDP